MSRSARVGFICPTYRAWDYTKLAVETFLTHTQDGFVILVDDASPDWGSALCKRTLAALPSEQSVVLRYDSNGGLTRSWNAGLRYARTAGIEYVVAGNSDIMFQPYWNVPLEHALKTYRLVGPVTNCPGGTAHGRQDIKHYYPDWRLSDDPGYLRQVAMYLYAHYPQSIVESPWGANGFFLYSKLEYWWEGSYDADCVFNPGDRYKMIRQEDELESRWRSRGWPTAICPGSFIFHFRSASRGTRFKRPGWMRMSRE